MKILLIFTATLLWSCSSNLNNDKSIIVDLMANQELAWNNGDLEDFMLPYYKSEDLFFVGKSGLNKGWSTTLNNYKKSYPNKEKMGRLLFENLELEPLGNEYFLVIGKWNLLRINDTLSGHYSLIWKKDGGEWKIIADHSS